MKNATEWSHLEDLIDEPGLKKLGLCDLKKLKLLIRMGLLKGEITHRGEAFSSLAHIRTLVKSLELNMVMDLSMVVNGEEEFDQDSAIISHLLGHSGKEKINLHKLKQLYSA